MADQKDFYSRYWTTNDDLENTDHHEQHIEYESIIELQNRIDDLETRMQWHRKSMARGNALSGFFKQFIHTERAKMDELKLEYEQRRTAYEKRYGIKFILKP